MTTPCLTAATDGRALGRLAAGAVLVLATATIAGAQEPLAMALATSPADVILPPSPPVARDVIPSPRLAFGRPTTVGVSAPNDVGLILFDGTSGQQISLVGTNGLTGRFLGCDINVSILKTDTTVLVPPTCMEQSGFIDVTTLPSTGTYTILVDPAGAATGSVTLTLHDVPANFSASIAPDGSPVTASMSTPGQNGVLTFSGTSGQRIFLKGTNGLSGQVLACDVNVKVLKPDASVLAANSCMENSGFIDTQMLPTTGTYTIVVDPVNHAVGNVTLALTAVPVDTTATATIGGPALTVTLGTPGQNATLTVSGTARQQVTVRITANTVGWVIARLKRPDGTVLGSLQGFASFSLPPQILPTTGTYTIELDPVGAAAGSLTLATTTQR